MLLALLTIVRPVNFVVFCLSRLCFGACFARCSCLLYCLFIWVQGKFVCPFGDHAAPKIDSLRVHIKAKHDKPVPTGTRLLLCCYFLRTVAEWLTTRFVLQL